MSNILTDLAVRAGGEGLAAPVVQVFDLRPARERLEAMVAAARQAIVEAHAAADRVRDDARAEGRELGRREGLELGRREGLELGLAAAAELRDTLALLLRDLEQHREKLRSDAERHLARLAVAVAERVVKAHVAADPQTVQRNVAAALELVAACDDLRVALAPQDVEAVRASLPDLAGTFQAAGHIHLEADERIARGGCLLRTAGGEIDATIQTQLDEIERQLTNRETEATS